MNGATVEFEGWHVWVQIIAFTIIFLAFCYFSIRALFMKKENENKMAAMPLEEDTNQSENNPKF